MSLNDRQAEAPCCPPKPALESRPLISADRAGDLRGLFKVLANETRLRVLHALVRTGELRVTDIADQVGMKPQAVSNQLQRLADQGILGSRRDGNNILYRIVDPCIPALLDQGLCLLEDAKVRQQIGGEISGEVPSLTRAARTSPS